MSFCFSRSVSLTVVSSRSSRFVRSFVERNAICRFTRLARVKATLMAGVAAVASRRAAELYGMDVLDEAIQDDKSNVTRFLALAREPLPPREGVPYKTSIACSMKEGSGAGDVPSFSPFSFLFFSTPASLAGSQLDPS